MDSLIGQLAAHRAQCKAPLLAADDSAPRRFGYACESCGKRWSVSIDAAKQDPSWSVYMEVLRSHVRAEFVRFVESLDYGRVHPPYADTFQVFLVMHC